mgnify:CR=1 FL=1
MRQKIAIIMPAYNAEKFVGDVIKNIPKTIAKKDVIVIDDGSKDDTYNIAKKTGATVLKHGKNKGYGAAQKTGYNYATKKGYDVSIMVHSDGQHDPKQVNQFIEMINSGFDVVTGTRFRSGSAWKQGMPLVKVIGNRGLSFLSRALTGLKVSETHNGYRAYTKKALKSVNFNGNSDKFEFDTEMLLRMKSKGLKIGEIPIRTIYNDARSNLNNYSYGVRVLKVILGHTFYGKYKG